MRQPYCHRSSFQGQRVLSQLAVVLLQDLLGVIRQDWMAVLPGIGNVFLEQLDRKGVMSLITAISFDSRSGHSG